MGGLIKRISLIIMLFIFRYSNYRVTEVEIEVPDVKIPFLLRGNETIKEDTADMGAVKISYEAYKLWSTRNKQKRPVGLQDFSLDQIFFIAHAQTFCAFERAIRTKTKVETSNYSIEKFRIVGPLSNSNDFARSFNCSPGVMSKRDDAKCLIW